MANKNRFSPDATQPNRIFKSPAVMYTLHASQITTAVIQANNPVLSVFLWFPRILAQFASKINFHTEYAKCVATVPPFSETSGKEFSFVLCEEPVILVELIIA